MTKKIAIISALALMLASCGSTGEQDPKISSTKETTTTASETVSISESVTEEEITLRDVQNWATADIWNKGFCDIGYYVKTGKDSTGRDIDIEFSISNLKNAMAKKDIYNEFIHNNYADYEQLLISWDKMIEQTDILFEKVTTETPRPNDESYEFSNDLFHQYFMSFYSECNSPTKGTAVTTKEKAESEAPETTTTTTTKIEEEDPVTEPEDEPTVLVTLPQTMVGNDPESYIKMARAEDGVISAELNDDGTVDIVYTEKKYTQICDEALTSSTDIIDRMLEKGNYTTITSITYNDDLTEFFVTVTDYNAYQSSMDSAFKIQLSICVGMYHAFLQDNATIIIHYLDQSGNEYDFEELS